MAGPEFERFHASISEKRFFDAGDIISTDSLSSDQKLLWINDAFRWAAIDPNHTYHQRLQTLIVKALIRDVSRLPVIMYILLRGRVVDVDSLFKIALSEIITRNFDKHLISLVDQNQACLSRIFSAGLRMYLENIDICEPPVRAMTLPAFLDTFKIASGLQQFDGIISNDVLRQLEKSPHSILVTKALKSSNMLTCINDSTTISTVSPSLGHNSLLFGFILWSLAETWFSQLLMVLNGLLSATRPLIDIGTAVAMTIHQDLERPKERLAAYVLRYVSVFFGVLQFIVPLQGKVGMLYKFSYHLSHVLFLRGMEVSKAFFWSEFGIQTALFSIDLLEPPFLIVSSPSWFLWALPDVCTNAVLRCPRLSFVSWISGKLQKLTSPTGITKYLMLQFVSNGLAIAMGSVLMYYVYIATDN